MIGNRLVTDLVAKGLPVLLEYAGPLCMPASEFHYQTWNEHLWRCRIKSVRYKPGNIVEMDIGSFRRPSLLKRFWWWLGTP